MVKQIIFAGSVKRTHDIRKATEIPSENAVYNYWTSGQTVKTTAVDTGTIARKRAIGDADHRVINIDNPSRLGRVAREGAINDVHGYIGRVNCPAGTRRVVDESATGNSQCSIGLNGTTISTTRCPIANCQVIERQ